MLDEVIKNLQEIREQDLTYDDLGTANGWHEAQSFKTVAEEHAEKVLDLVRAYGSSVQDVFLSESIANLDKQITQLKARAKSIVALVEKGTNQANYPQQRENLTRQIAMTCEGFQKITYPLENALKIARLESQLTAEDALRKIEISAGELLQKLTTISTDAEKIVQNLRNDLTEVAVDKAATNFSLLAAEHKAQEKFWFRVFLGASFFTVLAILWAVISFNSETEVATVLVDFVKRAFVVTAPAVFMRLAISKYNLERNLKIIYNHRDTVLEQYNIFESAISNEDVEAKNQFRLEIAKIVFSDPSTGYTGASSGSELNINPVLNTVEKIAKRT